MAYIYKITNDINGKIYIGKTYLSIDKRFKEHCRAYNRREYENRPLYSAMKKYGVEHFNIEEIEQCDNPEEREKHWIEYYGSFKNGYNATIGGDGKPYIDRDLVVAYYKEYGNQAEVARKMNISTDSVHNILIYMNEPIMTSGQISAKKFGKSVKMIDKTNQSDIKLFSNQSEAARWLMANGKTTDSDVTKISYRIGQVVNGKRKSAYGYFWKRVEND